MKISLKTEEKTFFAQLNDSQTAKDIIANLPVKSTVSCWGDEIYFELGFKASAEGATMDVDIGDVAYWSQGKCLCVFFGPTPASEDDRPVPASPVVIVGKTDASVDELKQIRMGEKITVSID
jgi:hypothetical protein